MHDPLEEHRIHVLFLMISQSVGGAELHTIAVANGLDKTRFRVSVVYLKDEADDSDIVRALHGDIKVFCGQVRRRFDPGAARRLRRFVNDEGVDIVVCTNRFALLYGWLVVRLAGLPVRLAEVFHTTELGTWKARMQMALYRPLFHSADLVVFVCETQQRFWQARKLKLAASSVIHNGIDVRRFRNDFSDAELLAVRGLLGFRGTDFVVGICASLRPEKAHLDLLDALTLLNTNGHAFKCMIIGDGPERGRIEQAIDARKLRADVAITGYLPDVRKHMAACDVMALVSHYIETFSLAALEAMSLGKPVIMSEVGGAVEQVIHGHNGLLYPAGDIQALADCILNVRSANGDGGLGSNARQSVVDRFTLDKMVRKFETTFVGMVGGHHGKRLESFSKGQ
ncbi:glycosyltransferase [Massilia alkalitolerans]|uniref:glycosyltransferase n=1 Tax=Massilia alkalitolerans TaxID=286638 RepID=UPI0028AF1D60|nr:glycosyltransferase [Massilia alkalitolerans]